MFAFLVPTLYSLFVLSYTDYAELYFSGVKTQGKVVSSDCRQHARFEFSYVVAGRRFTGTGQAGYACEKLLVGDVVDLHYLPRKPQAYEEGELGRYLVNLFWAYIFSCVFAIALGIQFIPSKHEEGSESGVSKE